MKLMKFYIGACKTNTNPIIHVHPLLLSLTETIDASDTNSDISFVSENDERVLESNFYVSPSTLPLLEIHFSGQNSLSLLFNQNGYALISVASCQDYIASALQDNLREGNAT
jgi:hypothetical protein